MSIRICHPCTISAYKLQNLVLVKRSSQNHRKMYLQIIVTLRYYVTDPPSIVGNPDLIPLIEFSPWVHCIVIVSPVTTE